MDAQDEKTSAPKVFVSYAHETPDHMNWVKALVADLRGGGIDALLDEYRVKPGEDFTLFMDEIRVCERVLLICTPTYACKSNEGVGGVGYERSVITAELAKTIDTAKFICVLRDADPTDSIPTFAHTRRFVDFRDDSEYEVRLDELCRALHDAPSDPEPPLGPNPYAGEQTPRVEQPREDRVTRDDPMSTAPIVEKATTILSRNDLIGWKRLLRETRRGIPSRLADWRTELERTPPSKDEWTSRFDGGGDGRRASLRSCNGGDRLGNPIHL